MATRAVMGEGLPVSHSDAISLPSDAFEPCRSLRFGFFAPGLGREPRAQTTSSQQHSSRRFFTTRMTRASPESRGASSLAAMPRRPQRGRPARAGGRVGGRFVFRRSRRACNASVSRRGQ